MTINEARAAYSATLKAYQRQANLIAEQREDLQKKIAATDNSPLVYAKEAATLELSGKLLERKQSNYKNYLDAMSASRSARANAAAAQEKVQESRRYFEDTNKLLTVARRLMHGDIVPPSDEKKLMEYDGDLYQMAKNAQVSANTGERTFFKSLWEEEDITAEETDTASSVESCEVVEVPQKPEVSAEALATAADMTGLIAG